MIQDIGLRFLFPIVVSAIIAAPASGKPRIRQQLQHVEAAGKYRQVAVVSAADTEPSSSPATTQATQDLPENRSSDSATADEAPPTRWPFIASLAITLAAALVITIRQVLVKRRAKR